MDEAIEFRVPDEATGHRLDVFLTEREPRLTRSGWQRLIRTGRVTLDGEAVAKPGVELRGGACIRASLPAAPPTTPVAESVPLDIVHEDDAILVVDKPAGMVVHPGNGRRSGTLVNALLGRGGPLAWVAGADRPGIVHRLDAGTSGLIVVARTDDAHRKLSLAFAERRVEKRYLALVWGHPDPPEGQIERAIGRSRTNAIRMDVRGVRGRPRPALSRYRTLDSFPGFSLVEVQPRTGRTHQIRVHMLSIHHPLVGDDRYGGPSWRGLQDPVKRNAVRDFARLGLHATGLAFPHPVDGRILSFESPPPAEFQSLLAVLRGDR